MSLKSSVFVLWFDVEIACKRIIPGCAVRAYRHNPHFWRGVAIDTDNVIGYLLFYDTFFEIFGKVGAHMLSGTFHRYFCHIGGDHKVDELFERGFL